MVATQPRRAAPRDVVSAAATKRVLLLHTGGTLGMAPERSFVGDELVPGTGGVYPPRAALEPGELLGNVLELVPELGELGASLQLEVVLNCDSCRLTPADWAVIARRVDERREEYDSFVVLSGTDTMAYVASALSYMLVGLNKPVIVTGSQRPLSMPRTDARQNLVDAVSCAVAGEGVLHEVGVCFGGLLLRGNRTQKTHSSAYRAFSSPTYPTLAKLGVDVSFNHSVLLPRCDEYRPRFDLVREVMRVPVVPGVDPHQAYGDVAGRGIRGIVLELFGVGNCDDREESGWIPWLREMRERGVVFFLTSQCEQGFLRPESYRSGSAAMMLGAESSRLMTPEAAVVKLALYVGERATVFVAGFCCFCLYLWQVILPFYVLCFVFGLRFCSASC